LLAFTSAELEPLIARIRQTAGQAPTGPPPGFGRALLSSIRYDRVRGPSTALGVVVHAGPIGIEARARAAIAMPDVETMLAFSRGAARLDLYRQLDDASDWNIADGLGNSAATLLFGHDGADYYRVTGASLTFTNQARRVRTSIELFAEAQRSVDRQTNVSLATMGGGSLRENIAAAPIDVAGLRASFAGQFGSDVGLGVLNWRIVAEAATGDADWGRTLGNVRYSGSFSQTAAFAVDISGGLAGVGAPVQREFLLGGAGTIRGVRENAIRGPAFWLARFESGFGLAGLRAIGFLDTGWAGERDGITKSRPATGLGAGASLFDGLLRFDIARGVSRAAAWRVYFRIDALL
jgi:hypothetical protein